MVDKTSKFDTVNIEVVKTVETLTQEDLKLMLSKVEIWVNPQFFTENFFKLKLC